MARVAGINIPDNKHAEVSLTYVYSFFPNKKTKESLAITGTMRALASNMIQGVGFGFEKKLEINGVGYRATLEGNSINLNRELL